MPNTADSIGSQSIQFFVRACLRFGWRGAGAVVFPARTRSSTTGFRSILGLVPGTLGAGNPTAPASTGTEYIYQESLASRLINCFLPASSLVRYRATSATLMKHYSVSKDGAAQAVQLRTLV
jgi:hypothetical protein